MQNRQDQGNTVLPSPPPTQESKQRRRAVVKPPIRLPKTASPRGPNTAALAIQTTVTNPLQTSNEPQTKGVTTHVVVKRLNTVAQARRKTKARRHVLPPPTTRYGRHVPAKKKKKEGGRERKRERGGKRIEPGERRGRPLGGCGPRRRKMESLERDAGV